VSYLNSACETLFGVSRRHRWGSRWRRACPISRAGTPAAAGHRRGVGFIERELTLRRFYDEEPADGGLYRHPIPGNRPGLRWKMIGLHGHVRIARDELMLAQQEASPNWCAGSHTRSKPARRHRGGRAA